MTLTPEQFNYLVNKDDLKEFEKKLEEKMDKRFNEVLKAIDRVMKEYETVKQEQTVNIAAHNRYEKRLTNIEGHLDLEPAV